MRLKNNFFKRDTLVVAQDLLGKYLVRKVGRKIIAAKITETEAYCGPQDKACHASKGYTERTKIMFGPPGRAYVYLIYGMYHCLNVVTEREGYPAAVLIRTAEILNPKSETLNKSKIPNPKIKNIKLKGPGILCRELKIDRKFNGVDLCNDKELWIESANGDPALHLGEGPRFSGVSVGSLSRNRRRGEKPPKRIKRGKRIGVDYAGKWKDKLWRFYL